ncbi:MAG: hypothetical protein R3E75_04960 [Steroidobacteraceae bacterium]
MATFDLLARVTAIGSTDDGVEVVCEDGARLRALTACARYRHRFFVTSRSIHLSSAKSANAVLNLDYHRPTQVHFGFTRRFWEDDGRCRRRSGLTLLGPANALKGHRRQVHRLFSGVREWPQCGALGSNEFE